MFFPVLVLKSVGILSFLIPDTVGETIGWLVQISFFSPKNYHNHNKMDHHNKLFYNDNLLCDDYPTYYQIRSPNILTSMHLNLHNPKNKYRNSPFSNDHIYHTMFQ